MTALALWLVVVGLCDLLRAAGDATSVGRRSLLCLIGLFLLGGGAVLVESQRDGVLGWLVGAAALCGWIVASSVVTTRGGTGHRVWVATSYLSLGAGLGGLAIAGPRGGSADGLRAALEQTALAGVDPDRLLLACGVLLVQVSTANIAVRLLLDVVGVPAGPNEKKLRGGRVLGPMERLLIVGLGLAGELTGAALVAAAKALLRFPELKESERAGRESPGPSDVTEYFLIGSFAS